jgi:hypothetical protein
MARSFSQHLTILADKCGQILRRNSVRNNPAKCVCVPVSFHPYRLPLVVFAFVLASCSGVEKQGASSTPGASVVETTAETLSDAVNNLDDLYESLESADVEFLEGIAGNPSTPGEVLTTLANDESDFVCAAVARNPSTHGELRMCSTGRVNVASKRNVNIGAPNFVNKN